MSDTETETQPKGEPEGGQPEVDELGNEPGPDDEPEEQIEGDDDGDFDGDEEQGEQGDEEQRQASARNEEEIERRKVTMRKEELRHTKRISEVMGADAADLIPCPVCMGEDSISGWIYSPEKAPLSAEVQDRMKQILGFNAWEDTPNAPWAQQCPDCKGHGEVKTGSFVLGKETTRCLNCGGDGWKNTRQGTNGTVETFEVPAETGPTVYGQDLSQDPDVQHLREKGYTVIPPMHVSNG